MFYTFKQFNPGGIFRRDMPEYLIIEAENAAQANRIAESQGVYFNGVAQGIDCECCGDRWHEVDHLDAKEVPTIYGESDLSGYRGEYRIIFKEKTC